MTKPMNELHEKTIYEKTIWILEQIAPKIEEAIQAAIIEDRKSGLEEGIKIGEVKALNQAMTLNKMKGEARKVIHAGLHGENCECHECENIDRYITLAHQAGVEEGIKRAVREVDEALQFASAVSGRAKNMGTAIKLLTDLKKNMQGLTTQQNPIPELLNDDSSETIITALKEDV